MTAIELAERRMDGTTESPLLHMLREDHSYGPVTTDVGCLTNVRLKPVTACDDPAEMGCIRKMLEMGGVAQLVRDRSCKHELPNGRARQVKHQLNYIRLARRLQNCGERLKGPLKVSLVWRIRLGNGNGNERTMLAVVFNGNGHGPYGYYFHLKAALLLCGMLY